MVSGTTAEAGVFGTSARTAAVLPGLQKLPLSVRAYKARSDVS
jgi:hypothetical protein